MKLGDYSESLAYEIAFWSQSLTAPDFPVAELGEVCVDLSRKFRVLSIALLLSRGDGRAFQDNLHRSGEVRRLYLERAAGSGLLDDHHYSSGRYSPLLDSIAAQSWDAAKAIAALSPTEFHEGHEYPDDYCFAQLTGALVSGGKADERSEQLLARWNEFLDGESDQRLEVCASLYARDSDAFAEAFDGLLRARESEIEEAVERGQISEADVYAERQVYVDGVALLVLAASLGIRTEPEYLYCPAIARAGRQLPFPRFPP